MADLKQLRAEVKRLHRAAGSKVSRVEKSGVKLRGSEFDPRRPAGNIDRYSKRQLEVYAQRLRDFNHRSTQFLPSSGGAPIPRRLWASYKHLERMNNIRSSNQMRQYGNIFVPHSGMTVEERDDLMVPKKRRMRTATVTRPVAPYTRETPAQIMGAEGLKKIMQGMTRKIDPKRIKRRVQDQMIEAADIADRLGDPTMKQKIFRLKPSQFDVLWNYTNMSEVMGQAYDSVDTAGEKGRQRVDDLGHMEDIHSRLDWAATIDADLHPEPPAPKRKRRRK